MRIEVVEPREEQFLVQAGGYREFSEAAQHQQTLADRLNEDSVVIKVNGLYKLRLGPLNNEVGLERLKALLMAADIQPIRVLTVP